MGRFEKHSIYVLGNLTSENLFACVKGICDLTVRLPYLTKQEFWSYIACVSHFIPLVNVFTAQRYLERSMALSGVPVPLVIRDLPCCLRKSTSL